MIETITSDDQIVAIIVYRDYHVDGIKFLSPTDFSLQVGHMSRPAGYQVVPEPTVGVLLLISSLGLLRRRLLDRARHEVLNQSQPPRQD